MAYRIGIIPAAGTANRFNGLYKELLPVNDTRSIIDYTVNAMVEGKADQIIIVTSARKISILAEYKPQLLYTLQTEKRDIWGAMLAGLRYQADEYIFGMPDTIYPADVFSREMDGDLMLGTFYTDMPQRFGMIRGDKVVNKEAGKAGDAWGVLMWSEKVADYWNAHSERIESYTQAINEAMSVFGFKTFKLKFYYDIASFFDYRSLP